MRAIAEVEKHLPWFWTPWPEGIRDVPYAYEYELKKRSLNSKGLEEFPPRLKDGRYKQARSLHLENTRQGRLGLGHPMHLAGRTGMWTL